MRKFYLFNTSAACRAFAAKAAQEIMGSLQERHARGYLTTHETQTQTDIQPVAKPEPTADTDEVDAASTIS